MQTFCKPQVMSSFQSPTKKVKKTGVAVHGRAARSPAISPAISPSKAKKKVGSKKASLLQKPQGVAKPANVMELLVQGLGRSNTTLFFDDEEKLPAGVKLQKGAIDDVFIRTGDFMLEIIEKVVAKCAKYNKRTHKRMKSLHTIKASMVQEVIDEYTAKPWNTFVENTTMKESEEKEGEQQTAVSSSATAIEA
jgi:hypothetical protein